MKNKIITGKDVVFWLGGTGNFTLDDCIEIISQVANGDYEVDQLKKDIRDYREMMS
jgi:hypothetical protein